LKFPDLRHLEIPRAGKKSSQELNFFPIYFPQRWKKQSQVKKRKKIEKSAKNIMGFRTRQSDLKYAHIWPDLARGAIIA
jgi:hypothetical protein